MIRARVLLILGTSLAGLGSSPLSAEGGRPVLLAFLRSLEAQAATASAQRQALHHQLRNADAMWELATALPESRRTDRVLYLAAGSHLAPLVVCEALPAGSPCALRFTEIDPAVQDDLDAGLVQLAKAQIIRELDSGVPLTATGGLRRWRFVLEDHPVGLELRVSARRSGGRRPPLVRVEDLREVDLVISHDWSGDPIGNLRVIRDVLDSARLERGTPPLLMIEDLERHPYPVDLQLFTPLARTQRPYGHRTSDAGLGQHGTVELGPSLFGGGVVLAFEADWWRRLETIGWVEGVLDFLLFNQFDVYRQNVLEGGDRAIIAPALLDWWSGYGIRTISGSDVVRDPEARQRMLRAAAKVAPMLEPRLARWLACRLQLYRTLLHLVAADADLRSILPGSAGAHVLEPGGFPSPQMERLYREASANRELYEATRAREQTNASQLLELLQSPTFVDSMAPCEIEPPRTEETTTAWRTRVYRSLVEGFEPSHVGPK